MSDTDAIRVAHEGVIATVTLHRPDKLNALDHAAWRRLAEVFDELSADADLRCVVLTGAGGVAFGAGADISAFGRERRDSGQAAAYGRDMDAAMDAIAGGLHPTIAAIEGLCVGGGLEVACACDLRICGAGSRFGIPVARLGLTMGYGELRALLSVIAAPLAREMLYSGELFDAPRALQMGLVNRIVDDGGVAAAARELAARIAAGAPLVNRWHKKFIRRLADAAPLNAAEIAEGYAAFDTEDFRRGHRAFLGKTDPQFEGD